MPNLGEWEIDVPFNQGAAQALIEELGSAARFMEEQAEQRQRNGSAALESWQGNHALQFGAMLKISTRDAQGYADALVSAANGLRVLAERAMEEQQRRLAVRAAVAQYEATNAEWAEAGQVSPYSLDYFVQNIPPPIEPPILPAFAFQPTPRGQW